MYIFVLNLFKMVQWRIETFLAYILPYSWNRMSIIAKHFLYFIMLPIIIKLQKYHYFLWLCNWCSAEIHFVNKYVYFTWEKHPFFSDFIESVPIETILEMDEAVRFAKPSRCQKYSNPLTFARVRLIKIWKCQNHDLKAATGDCFYVLFWQEYFVKNFILH